MNTHIRHLPAIARQQSKDSAVFFLAIFFALVFSNLVYGQGSPNSPPCAPQPNDLVAWWPLDGNGAEIMGGPAVVFLGNPNFAAGKVGMAMVFDGVHDAARAGASSALDLGATDGLTLELWIKPATVSQQQPLIEWSDTSATVGLHLWLSVSTPFTVTGGGAGSLFANLISTAGVAHHVSSPPGLLTTNAFQHVALTYERVNGLARLYLNGMRVAETFVGNFSPETRADVYFGQRPLGGGTARFMGLMDEVSFYRRALSETELLAIFQAGASGKCQATNIPPVITTSSQSQTVIVGETASFSVVAGGSAPLSYQWFFNDNALAGGTNATLVLANVQSDQAGSYSVAVQNPAGSVTSDPATLTVNPPPPCVASPGGLVAWWPLEGNAIDVVGSSEVVLSGQPAFVAGKAGQGLAFDGAGDSGRIAAGSALNLGGGGGLTVEMWIKPSSLAQQQALVEWSDAVSTVGLHFWISVSTPFTTTGGGPGSLFANLIDTSGQAHHVSSAPGILHADAFQHVALTYERASGLARMYLNGVQVAQTNAGNFAPETRTDVYLGRRKAGSPAYRFAGVMDELSFYNRALDAAEIQAIASSGITGKCPMSGAPLLVRQPQNATVLVDDTVRFSVSAVGTPPLAYQWLFQGNALAGETNATLVLANVQTEQAGQYAVVVENGAGSVTSDSATLTVNPRPLCVAPPNGLAAWWPLGGGGEERVAGNTMELGGTPQFADGQVGQGLSFDGMDDESRAPATAESNIGAGEGLTVELWVRPHELERAGALVEWSDDVASVGVHFWVSVWSPFSGGGAGSLFANLIDTGGHAHHLSSAPGTLRPDVFQHVALTYERASGLARLYLNGASVLQTNVGSFVPDTRTDVYFGRRKLGGLAYRFVGVMDEITFYNRALNAAELEAIYAAGGSGKCPTNQPPVALPPVIVSQPAGQTAIEGSVVTFAVVARSSAPLAYQWLFNGTDLAGATQPSLTIASAHAGDAGAYSVRVSNSAGMVVSDDATLTVQQDTRPPAITQQPFSQSVTPGANTSFSVVAVGVGPLVYQWRAGGVDLSGETNSTLVIENAQSSNAGVYSVEVRNPFGSVLSTEAFLTVTTVVSGGIVYFANRVIGFVDAPIFDSDGVTRLAGTDYRVELFAGPTVGEMAVVGPSVPFRTGAAVGYIVGSVRTIPSVPAGGTAFVQLRAWDFTRGTNYDQALANGAKAGASPLFTVITGGGGSPPEFPANLVGLESFSLSGSLVAASLAPVQAVLSPAGVASDGGLIWRLRGRRGVAYVIECSGNLVDWLAFTTVTAVDGTATFKDPPGQRCNFYRARLRQ